MRLLMVVIFMFSLAGPVAAKPQLSEREAQTLRKRLYKRKVAWEAHKEAQQAYEKRRRAAANKLKKRRYEQAFVRKKVRANFVRTDAEFPVQAYRRFIAKRDRRLERVVKKRNDYRQLRKSLAEIIDSNQYKIDKMEEYNLR